MVAETQIFVDTSWFKALADSKDEFHQKAISQIRGLRQKAVKLVTSNFVLDETFTLIRARCGLARVEEFRTTLSELGGNLTIVRVTSDDEAQAWQWFVKDWSRLSFTDCVSFALMKRLGLKKVLSFDQHFKRAGFS